MKRGIFVLLCFGMALFAAWSLVGQSSEEGWPEAGITLWFGGDVHLIGDAESRLASLESLVEGDAGFVNLEAPVGEDARATRRVDSVELVNHRSVLSALYTRGVRVVGLENNHRLDLGEAGYSRTLAAAHETGLRVADRHHHARLNLEGVRIGFVSRWLDEPDAMDGLERELNALRLEVDLLIASYHVNHRSYLPSERARDFEAIAHSQGADLVVGHGSHAVGPAYRKGKTLVVHGLGNLVFDCECTQEREGLLLQARWGRHGLLEAKLIPIDAGLLGRALQPSNDPAGVLDLMEGLGATLAFRDKDAGFLYVPYLFENSNCVLGRLIKPRPRGFPSAISRL